MALSLLPHSFDHTNRSKHRTSPRNRSKGLYNRQENCRTRSQRHGLLRCEQACSTWRQLHVDKLVLLETNIDDTSPQILAYTMEELFSAGGLDVWAAPVYMKKGRPGTLLRVLCETRLAEDLVHVIFKVCVFRHITLLLRKHLCSKRKQAVLVFDCRTVNS